MFKQGKNQTAIGITPINFDSKSTQSSLSVYPIAIGNCKDERYVSNNIILQQANCHN